MWQCWAGTPGEDELFNWGRLGRVGGGLWALGCGEVVSVHLCEVGVLNERVGKLCDCDCDEKFKMFGEREVIVSS
jgi:hypothetical protein